jgi:hypothetical protein
MHVRMGCRGEGGRGGREPDSPESSAPVSVPGAKFHELTGQHLQAHRSQQHNLEHYYRTLSQQHYYYYYRTLSQ